MAYDAFISYRRSDGSAHAAALRRGLLDFRFPRRFADPPKRQLSIYLDTIYERATEDFFENTIKPALRDSKRLIIVRTPDALTRRGDGSENWVEREISEFRSLPQGKNLSVALAAGEIGDPLPGSLHRDFANVEVVDIRRIRRRWSSARGDAVLTFAAELYEIPQERMPDLRAEEARQRASRLRALAGAAAALAAALFALAAWALVSRSAARQSEAVAVEQRQIALARQLAAESNVLRLDTGQIRTGREIELSALLAIESYRIHPTVEGEVALRNSEGLLVPQTFGVIPHHGDPRRVAISDDARIIVTANGDEVAITWHDGSGKPATRSLPVKDHATEIALSADARWLAVASKVSITVWPVGEPASEPISRCDARDADALAMANDGRTVAAGNEHGVSIVDCQANRRQPVPGTPDDYAEAIAFDNQGRWLAAAIRDVVHVWNRGDWKSVAELRHGDAVTDLSFSADGSRLATGSADTAARLFDTHSWSETLRVQPRDPVVEVRLSGDGTLLATMSGDRTTRVWETEHGREIARLAQPDVDRRGALAFTSDDAELISVSGARVVAADLRPPCGEIVRQKLAILSNLNFRDDGGFAVVGDPGFVIRIDAGREPVDQDSRPIKGQKDGSETVEEMCGYVGAANPPVVLCKTFPWDRVVLRAPDSLALLGEIKSGTVWRLVVSPNGRYGVISSSEKGDAVWSLSQRTPSLQIPDAGSDSQFAIDEDGRIVVAWDDRHRAFAFDTKHGLSTPIDPDEETTAVGVSGDGSMVVTASGFSVHVTKLPGHGGAAQEIARIPITRRPGLSRIEAVAFDRSGKQVAAGGDKEISTYRLRVSDVVDRACSSLTRNLTFEEWQKYLPGQPRRRTCDRLPEMAARGKQ